MLTGFTADTKQNIQLGAGVLTTSYTQGGTISPTDIIGATKEAVHSPQFLLREPLMPMEFPQMSRVCVLSMIGLSLSILL